MSKPKNENTYRDIIFYINDYIDKYSRSPSVREIAAYVNLAVSTTQYYLDRLLEEGKLAKKEGKRGIFTKTNNLEKINVPLVGVVACGTPILAEENIEEYLSISKNLLGDGDFFALEAKGDSMIEAGIESGDIVFIRKQNYANNGQIVVALIDDEVTLKRFYKDDKRNMIRLHPENSSMTDIYVENCFIQGIAIKIVKDVK